MSLQAVDEAVICRWLAGLFATELDEETIGAYRDGAAAPFLAYLASDCGLGDQAGRLRTAIDGWAGIEDLRLELAGDFGALFHGDARHAAVPYASAYCGRTRDLFQEPHERMQARLGGVGLAVREDRREPADHLSIMLEYLALRLAAEREGSAPQAPDEGSAGFVREELLNWLPAFAQMASRIRTASDTYPAVIALTLAFLEGVAAS